jgi:hypothetical protein
MHRWLTKMFNAGIPLRALGRAFVFAWLAVATSSPVSGAGLSDFPSPGISAAHVRHFEITKGKVRVQGTSNLDDWQVESVSVQGFLELGPTFPPEPPRKAAPGPVDARARLELNASSLKSVEKDGKPFSNKMDQIMYEKLRASAHPKIVYRLQSLVLKEASESADAPFLLESTGELLVGGVTNQIAIPLKLWSTDNKNLKLTGNTSLRMTDFHIEPPSPKIALGFINTGNEVKLTFECALTEKETSHE